MYEPRLKYLIVNYSANLWGTGVAWVHDLGGKEPRILGPSGAAMANLISFFDISLDFFCVNYSLPNIVADSGYHI